MPWLLFGHTVWWGPGLLHPARGTSVSHCRGCWLALPVLNLIRQPIFSQLSFHGGKSYVGSWVLLIRQTLCPSKQICWFLAFLDTSFLPGSWCTASVRPPCSLRQSIVHWSKEFRALQTWDLLRAASNPYVTPSMYNAPPSHKFLWDYSFIATMVSLFKVDNWQGPGFLQPSRDPTASHFDLSRCQPVAEFQLSLCYKARTFAIGDKSDVWGASGLL